MTVHAARPKVSRSRSPLILSAVVGLAFLLLISAIFTVSFKARELARNAENSHQITEVLRLAAAVRSDLSLGSNLETIAAAGLDVSNLQEDIRAGTILNLATLQEAVDDLNLESSSGAVRSANQFTESAALEMEGSEAQYPERYQELVSALKTERTRVQAEMASQNTTMNRVGSTTAYGIAFLLPALALYLFEALRRFSLRADLNERLALESADRQQALASQSAHVSDLVSRSLVDLQRVTTSADGSAALARASLEVRRLRNSALASGATVATVLRSIHARELIDRAIAESSVTDIGVQLALTEEAVIADEENLRFVLVELLHNAAHDAGSEVQVTGYQLDGQVVLSILDNGPGLRPEVERAIFTDDRFVIRRETARGTHGSGLRAARSLLEAMGASLDYERESGMTQFTVSLPLAMATVPAVENIPLPIAT